MARKLQDPYGDDLEDLTVSDYVHRAIKASAQVLQATDYGRNFSMDREKKLASTRAEGSLLGAYNWKIRDKDTPNYDTKVTMPTGPDKEPTKLFNFF